MKIIRWILLAIVSIFLILTLGARLFGVQYYVVRTSSMHPSVPKFSLVYIKELNPADVLDEIQVGDIISIDTGGTLPLMHRIIEIDGSTITTKGDHNDTADDPINSEQIIGIMIFSIPVLGFLFMSVYPWIIITLLIILYYGIRYVIKELKKA
ncbi:MAG: signal peptidase I [Bacilli bacterium]|jgi:signal peptidase|nr:signal peptidase I [Bacilli bacterium]